MSRNLTPDEAGALGAGDDHYRAYVGPPKRYGLLTLSQMSLLTALGLEETDKVLDFGCGSLRLGRSLIPFLRSGHYYGVDPNTWLIDDALKWESGQDLMGIKTPTFSDDADFNCAVFGDVKFDFIVAQSIITHAGENNTRSLLTSAADALADDGVFILSYLKGEEGIELPQEPWTYPFNVPYPESWLKSVCDAAGLHWIELDWHHPGAQWAAISKSPHRLPEPGAMLGANGHRADRWRA